MRTRRPDSVDLVDGPDFRRVGLLELGVERCGPFWLGLDFFIEIDLGHATGPDLKQF